MRYLLLFSLLVLSACTEFEPKDTYPYQYPGCDTRVNKSKVKTFDMKKTRYFNSGDSSELVKCLPNLEPHGYIELPIYRVKLKNLKAGEIVVILYDIQVTNDFVNELMFVNFVTVNGVEVNERQGHNVSLTMHHSDRSRDVAYYVEADTDELEITVWAYTAEGRSWEPSYLKVDQDYGRLSGYVER